jgi:cell wall-associated NlpC family hydrolase
VVQNVGCARTVTRMRQGDCADLVRGAIWEAAGVDVGPHTDAIAQSPVLEKIIGGIESAQIPQFAQPGDILIFGGTPSTSRAHTRPGGTDRYLVGTEHTGIYIGGGMMLNTPAPGAPVRADNAAADGRTTEILRIKP